MGYIFDIDNTYYNLIKNEILRLKYIQNQAHGKDRHDL